MSSTFEFRDGIRRIASIIPEPSPEFSKSILDLRQVPVFLFLVLFSILLLLFLRLAFQRQKYSSSNPGPCVRFFEIKGIIKRIPFTEKARNGHTFFVHAFQLLGGLAKVYQKEKMCMIYAFYTPAVQVLKPEVVEEILMKTKLNEKAWIYAWMEPWLNTGLFTSNGVKWRTRRKMLTPCFHFDILKDFMPGMCEQTEVLVDILGKETGNDHIDITKPIQLCTLDIIYETSFGVKINAQMNGNAEICQSISKIMNLIVKRLLNVFCWPDSIYSLTGNGKESKRCIQCVQDFTRKAIREKKQKLLNGDVKTSKQKRKALMDFLLEHHMSHEDFTEEDIREEVDTFTVEGHDTTATSTVWALYLIGLDKKVQWKISEEQDRIFGEDRRKYPTPDDLKDMKYLECVIKETMRLFPALPITARNVPEETEICGFKFPKGTTVLIDCYHIHRDPEIYPDPEKFDPDRFLLENALNRHPFAYIPFLAGHRNCIGQKFAMVEMKIILSAILRNFTLESLDPRDKVLPSFELIVRPAIPVRMRIRPRRRSSTRRESWIPET